MLQFVVVQTADSVYRQVHVSANKSLYWLRTSALLVCCYISLPRRKLGEGPVEEQLPASESKGLARYTTVTYAHGKAGVTTPATLAMAGVKFSSISPNLVLC